MTLKEVVDYFGTGSAATRAIGMARQNLAAWKRMDHIPLKNQHLFEILTDGLLKASLDDTNYKERGHRSSQAESEPS